MTVDVNSGGGVTPYDPEMDAGLGFEDIGAGDMTLPRLTINHKAGLFKNSLSGEEFPVLKAVLLGVIKQRVMWDETVDTGDRPMCKSPNHDYGFPNVDPKTHVDKQFPWARSNFTPDMAKPLELSPNVSYPEGWSSNGLLVLPCAACKFSKWDQDGVKVPPCAEQHTYPLMYETEDGGLMPALISFQKTGIKPSKTYINAFAQSKTPMFTQWSEIKLNQFSRGSVDYCVPTFKKVGETPRDMWGEFAQQYRGVRNFVRQAPRNADEEETDFTPSDNINKGPDPWADETGGQAQNAAAAAVLPSTPMAKSTPAESSSAPAASPTPTAPVTPSSRRPSVVPTVNTPTPTPSEPTPAVGDVSVSADDDDLPF